MSDEQPIPNPVEHAWNEAARGYDAYFSPRFAPYLGTALGTLIGYKSQLPSGCILVPCTGPGRELGALARAFPERSIAGSDLSGEMVTLSRERNAQFANVSVEQADATRLRAPGPVAALYSVFGLQLLPDPAATLSSWLRLLQPKGLAVIVYWPKDSDNGGPFDTLHRLIAESSTADRSWEGKLHESARAASARVREDVRIAFEIQHDDAASFWQALTRLGPLRGLANARGSECVARLGARYAATFPEGPLRHTSEARLLLIERAG
ncbi:MAG TPA: class I SAM-dependent methyltransferase [Polyangiaceae bacterium]|jgi:SAM-dependent methyltransferase|nr:class I SAM-dependent methyltransferase [Polyangiaceae bacterium]